MSFFTRKREELAAKGIDPARVPPDQYITERFPVLHAGVVPDIAIDGWEFTVGGLVHEPLVLRYEVLTSLPTREVVADIHCVTKWSKLDTRWEGVAVRSVLDLVGPLVGATHVVVGAEHGFTANLPLDDFGRDDNLFAWKFDGERLEPEHGWPLRLVVPHLYFWKSVKWVQGFDLVDHDEPGFWERNGYHMYGDPWQEQRFWGD